MAATIENETTLPPLPETKKSKSKVETVSIKVISDFNLACNVTGRIFTPGIIHEAVVMNEYLQSQIDAGLVIVV